MLLKQLEMHKEFVPYEETLALKKLGFDIEDSLGWYNPEKVLHDYVCADAMSAPLYQQAFRWFREKYNLKGYPVYRSLLDDSEHWWDWLIIGEEITYKKYDTYEEAQDACLKELIEIVKQNKDE